MTGEAIISQLKDLKKIPGADRIVQATIFGETVIVSKDHKEGEIGVLFDCETQLSHEFCYENNLYRHNNLNKDVEKKGYIEDNRRVRPIRLKGVKCSGLWMPISSLDYLKGIKGVNLSIGTQFSEIAEQKICEKYINQATKNAQGNKQGKSRENLVPTFKEHIDTDQYARNKHAFKAGQLVYITEKLHGTSCRVGHLAVLKPLNKFQKFFAFIFKFIFKFNLRSDYLINYSHIVGSRRVVKQAGEADLEKKESYYESDIWSHSAEQFRDKLEKGETLYYEIVGFTPDGTSIMGSQSNSKLEKFMDKADYTDFLAKYGPETEFKYGCSYLGGLDQPQYKVFVYRITMTNEDGHTIDYSWEQVKNRCEMLGVEHVPELHKLLVTQWENGEDDRDKYLGDQYGNKLDTIVENHTEADSELFPTQLREGVCIRIEDENLIPKFLKNKGYLFKVLEGIIKESDTVDMEESQG